jgi:CelD/BcsL family acetyltransferase involved in cellulose biosynthesis
VLEGGVEVIARLASEWRELCSEGPCDEPFFRPEWFLAYVRAFEPAARLVVATARVDGRLRGVMPLVRERGHLNGLPVRKLRGAANSHSCRFDFVHGVGQAAEAAAAVWRELRQKGGWDVIELRDVPTEGAASLLLAAARADGHRTGSWERAPMPYLTLPAAGSNPEQAVEHLSAKHRRSLRNYRRKLEELGTVVVTRDVQPDQVKLDRFYDLEGSGWKGARGTAIACGPRTRRFYDELARLAGLGGSVTLYALECGPDTVAVQYGLTYKGTYFGLKSAYDERFARLSPGNVLTDAVVRDLVARGLHEIDFMGEPDDFKARWCSGERSFASHYVFRRGPQGRLLHCWKFRLLVAARRLKRRLGEARA